jgi:acyl-CoA:acyl-CoA alkyltransferase
MHLDSIKAAFPSRVVSNEEIIELVRRHSREAFEGDLPRALALIEKLLLVSGARSRRWLAEGETPIALVESAVTRALADAGIDKREVELLIYVGVGKGFAEPGQSYLVAHALGMDRAECFDVLDACMSWTRAMHLAEGMLRLQRYRRILIVNAELNTFEGGPLYPCNYRLQSQAQLEWTFASYTIGGAATAALVSADPDRPWVWRFASRPDLAELCTIPSAGHALFAKPSEKSGKNGVHRFTSFGRELHAHAREPTVALLREILAEHANVKRIFPHASSFKEWDSFAGELGVTDRMHHMYPDHGNLVSASVPAGIADAVEAGLVQRGDQLAGWVGSAGMSFSAYTFRY